MKLLSDAEVTHLEQRKQEGFTSREVVEIFQQRGVRLTTATFRKYVQMGLLPRARRVGRGGRHGGSAGLYPPSTVRALNLIKRLLAEDLTLEEIKASVALLGGEVEQLEDLQAKVLASLERSVRDQAVGQARERLLAELQSARDDATQFVRRVRTVGKRMTASLERSGTRRTGSTRGRARKGTRREA